jgi:membrane protease subunit HflK
MPGGTGLPGSFVFLLAVVGAAVVAFYAFTFRVNPDELGRRHALRQADPQRAAGLHFRLPYPIEEVRLPKVTRQNIIEVGMRSGRVVARLCRRRCAMSPRKA